jgi:hypothetical protein
MPNKKRKTTNLTKRFLTDRRAISVALTTMIITGGVLAAGITVLYWTYSMGDVANREYSTAIGNSQNATKESISFEYIHYQLSSKQLNVYMINCGKVNDTKIVGVYIYDAAGNLAASYHSQNQQGLPLITFFSGTVTSLNIGVEGWFNANPNLAPGYYNIRIVTERGRNFDGSFTTQ